MNEIIRIEDMELERVEYNGQPVLTLAMVDKIHQKPDDTARRNFNNNRDYFSEGEDFYSLPYEEWSFLVGKDLPDQGGVLPDQKAGGHRGNMTFLTLSGYLQLGTTFTGEQAWRVRKLLVRSYFKLKDIQALASKDAEKDRLKDELLDTQRRYIALLERKKVVRRMTPEEKKAIFDLHAAGNSIGEIARRTGRSKATVSNIVNYGGSSSGRFLKGT